MSNDFNWFSCMRLDHLRKSAAGKQSNTFLEALLKISLKSFKVYPAPDQSMFLSLFS